ncbi:MAG: group II intron reverse transcriptase/maturase, partial [Candidatus Humimicrobiaceae bacterium]
MIKASISLQELRRKIYLKAKSEKTWRFWGLYVHVCKPETLRQAYKLAKVNNGASGIDGVTFEAIQEAGLDDFLTEIRNELVSCTYLPLRNRRKEIPKESGKVRVLRIPAIRDRVVQGAIKLILEPIFEADFCDGSYGYRPKRSAHAAVNRVSEAVINGKTKVIDVDLEAYFDNVGHDILLGKVAQRVDDDKVMRLLKLILKANAKRGLAQGGVISPLLANIYLNEIDKMLEKAKEVTSRGKYTNIEYARFADDLVILVNDNYKWLTKAAYKRLIQELAKLKVKVNSDKTKIVDLTKGDTFSFLGFVYRRVKTAKGKWAVVIIPKMKARTALLGKLKEIFARFVSQPVSRVIYLINPILRGWVNYFRIGHSSKCFGYVKGWVSKEDKKTASTCKKTPWLW